MVERSNQSKYNPLPIYLYDLMAFPVEYANLLLTVWRISIQFYYP